jgi:N-hydroxyarylamine O-acetyltransferase
MCGPCRSKPPQQAAAASRRSKPPQQAAAASRRSKPPQDAAVPPAPTGGSRRREDDHVRQLRPRSWRNGMNDDVAREYLERIGVGRPPFADAAALRALHRAHQLAVPFENLSIHLGEPISLAEADLADKIVRRRRGGFCYELNGLFALLLEALGAQVTRLAARVYGGAQSGPPRPGPPFDHLALAVRLPDGTGPWLADVGFGRHAVYPLALDGRGEQEDPGGRFRLAETADADLDLLRDGELQYRIERRERALADFVPTCWWQQTSPSSHFTQSTVCSRLTPAGRLSISGRTLIETSGESRTEEPLATDAELLAAYRDYFGIILDRVPATPVG